MITIDLFDIKPLAIIIISLTTKVITLQSFYLISKKWISVVWSHRPLFAWTLTFHSTSHQENIPLIFWKQFQFDFFSASNLMSINQVSMIWFIFQEYIKVWFPSINNHYSIFLVEESPRASKATLWTEFPLAFTYIVNNCFLSSNAKCRPSPWPTISISGYRTYLKKK